MTLLFGGPLGEELGWRGFALPTLQKNHSPLIASVILGFFWALWHAPLDFCHGFVLPGVQGVALRLIFAMPLALLFTFFYNRMDGSVLVAILLHTSINSAVEFLEIQSALAYGAILAAVLVLACVVAVWDAMWHRERRSGRAGAR